jgi:hypothetical protein
MTPGAALSASALLEDTISAHGGDGSPTRAWPSPRLATARGPGLRLSGGLGSPGGPAFPTDLDQIVWAVARAKEGPHESGRPGPCGLVRAAEPGGGRPTCLRPLGLLVACLLQVDRPDWRWCKPGGFPCPPTALLRADPCARPGCRTWTRLR